MEEAVTVLYSEYNEQKLRQIILTVMYLVYTDMLRIIRYSEYLVLVPYVPTGLNFQLFTIYCFC